MITAGQTARRRDGGFTLFELLIVIVVTGLLLGGLLVPLSERLRLQQIVEEQNNLQDLRDALIGFAQVQGRLPCADTNGNGLENAPCGNSVGALPFTTIGVEPSDRWGRDYVYAVTGAMTVAANTGQPAPNAGLDLQDAGAFTLVERLEDKNTRNITTNAAAVVVSLGINGFGGTDSAGNVLVAPTGVDELENTDGDTSFVTRVRSESVAPCDDDTVGSTVPLCEFDDLVEIIPTPLLLGRMVQAGQLP